MTTEMVTQLWEYNENRRLYAAHGGTVSLNKVLTKLPTSHAHKERRARMESNPTEDINTVLGKGRNDRGVVAGSAGSRSYIPRSCRRPPRRQLVRGNFKQARAMDSAKETPCLAGGMGWGSKREWIKSPCTIPRPPAGWDSPGGQGENAPGYLSHGGLGFRAPISKYETEKAWPMAFRFLHPSHQKPSLFPRQEHRRVS